MMVVVGPSALSGIVDRVRAASNKDGVKILRYSPMTTRFEQKSSGGEMVCERTCMGIDSV